MPIIEFEGNELGPPIAVACDGGSRILDVCDDARAPVAFACRAAGCGTCRVEVLAGAALLAPPEPPEIEVLELLGVQAEAEPTRRAAPRTQRLACQAIARPGTGRIRLRWVGAARDPRMRSPGPH